MHLFSLLVVTTSGREQILFDGDVDYDKLSTRKVVKFHSGEKHQNPLSIEQVRSLQEIEEVVGSDIATLTDLLNFAERLNNEIGEHGYVGLLGFATAPEHFNHPKTVIDGLIAITDNETEISVNTQRDCCEMFRNAEMTIAEDDRIHVWYD